jgi:hypothetical protein
MLIVGGGGNGFPQKQNGKRQLEAQAVTYTLGAPDRLKKELLMEGNGVVFSP